MHVLIVDDDRPWLEAVSELVRRAGHQVSSAASFNEAIQLLGRLQPDLLVTDVRLGEYNGLYLVVRSRATHPHMASIVVSGFPDEVLEREAKHYGARAFLIKPVSASALLELIAAIDAERRRRKWPRKDLPVGLEVLVNGAPARLLNVSYGGFRVELAPAVELGEALDLHVPGAGIDLRALPVWTRPAAETGRLCGAMVLEMPAEARARWQGLVDSVVAVS
ncbi:MAG TPA: response regulator [Vicinamibacterales bacterium]|nr:response regulator [Vicinamibacterales bacterium]